MTEVTVSPELADALQAVDTAREMVERAKAQTEESIRHLRDIARRFLMAAEDDTERLSRAGLVYWTLPDVPTSVIAAVLIGDESKAACVAPMLPKRGFGIFCDGCGAEIKMRSRSDLYERRKNRRRAELKGYEYQELCRDCASSRQATITKEFYERQRQDDARIEGLRAMPYREYLLTDEWLETRNRKLRQARFRCQLCDAGGLLNVHHRTYERRGFEDMADLIVLCHPCHAKFHGKLP